MAASPFNVLATNVQTKRRVGTVSVLGSEAYGKEGQVDQSENSPAMAPPTVKLAAQIMGTTTQPGQASVKAEAATLAALSG